MSDDIQRCLDARNLMADVRREYPEGHIIHKAAVAAEQSCEIAWELIERKMSMLLYA